MDQSEAKNKIIYITIIIYWLRDYYVKIFGYKPINKSNQI